MVKYPKEVLEALERDHGIKFKEKRDADGRIAYGAGCSWWDSIDKVDVTSNGLPCCPNCKGMLFEVESEAEWFRLVDSYKAANESVGEGYRKFVEWVRGKCFPNYKAALKIYNAETNINLQFP